MTVRPMDKPGWRAGVNQALGWEWQPWTPTLTATTTDPSGWTGTGRWYQVGSLVVCRFKLTAQTGMTAGSGTYRVSLPIAADLTISSDTPLGQVALFDLGTGGWTGFAVATAAQQITVYYHVAAVAGAWNFVGAALPWTWAAGDVISGTITYESALPS